MLGLFFFGGRVSVVKFGCYGNVVVVVIVFGEGYLSVGRFGFVFFRRGVKIVFFCF